MTIVKHEVPKIKEEENFCKNCKESIKKLGSLEVFKAQINTSILANSQSTLEKANEMMSFYAQYLPVDYFSEDDDLD